MAGASQQTAPFCTTSTLSFLIGAVLPHVPDNSELAQLTGRIASTKRALFYRVLAQPCYAIYVYARMCIIACNMMNMPRATEENHLNMTAS